MCSFEGTGYQKNFTKEEAEASFCEFAVKAVFLDSSVVERSAVNRNVVGSSPTRGAKKTFKGLSH